MQAFHSSQLQAFLQRGLDTAPAPDLPEASLLTAITVDTLVAGVHFPASTPADWIAYKSLAVNLSDLAAMGAQPSGFTLGLILPVWDQVWLEDFRRGLSVLARPWSLPLLACDVRKGPLSVTIQALGRVAAQDALLRSAARPGDQLYVSGSLGDAACALAYYLKDEPLPPRYHEFLQQRLNCPQPRLQLGMALAGLASAAIDISDGLAADLGHILDESGVAASVQLERLPCSAALGDLLDPQSRLHYQLAGGDDYELCFTVPPAGVDELQQRMSALDVPCSCIGVIEAGSGIRYRQGDEVVSLALQGYDHFSTNVQVPLP